MGDAGMSFVIDHSTISMGLLFKGMQGCVFYKKIVPMPPEMTGLEPVLYIDLFPRTDKSYKILWICFREQPKAFDVLAIPSGQDEFRNISGNSTLGIEEDLNKEKL